MLDLFSGELKLASISIPIKKLRLSTLQHHDILTPPLQYFRIRIKSTLGNLPPPYTFIVEFSFPMKNPPLCFQHTLHYQTFIIHYCIQQFQIEKELKKLIWSMAQNVSCGQKTLVALKSDNISVTYVLYCTTCHVSKNHQWKYITCFSSLFTANVLYLNTHRRLGYFISSQLEPSRKLFLFY